MSYKMKNIKREQLYIALEGFNFDWRLNEVKQFDLLWNSGENIQGISRKMKRSEVEILLLYMDRVSKENINPDSMRVLCSVGK